VATNDAQTGRYEGCPLGLSNLGGDDSMPLLLGIWTSALTMLLLGQRPKFSIEASAFFHNLLEKRRNVPPSSHLSILVSY
jgi:hypothetical protein